MTQPAISQIQGVQQQLRGLAAATDRAASQALNRGIQQARTQSNKLIREELRLKAGYLNENMRVVKRASPSDLTSVLSARKRGILMSNYPHRALKGGGVSVQIKAGGGRVLLKSAFTMKFQNGATGIMLREKSGGGLRGDGEKKSRSYGLKTLYSPSASQAFSQVRDDVLLDVGSKVVEEFMRLKAWRAKA